MDSLDSSMIERNSIVISVLSWGTDDVLEGEGTPHHGALWLPKEAT